ncbi:hypothetical protein R80B4_03276 [Fibrobacteres bacterium R8-0-B4]
MNYWQCACGSVAKGNNYYKVCLDCDVIMIGPGHAGPYPGCQNRHQDFGVGTWESVKNAKRVIDQFVEEIKDGDVVVLNYGTKKVFGVGVVVGEYVYNCNFGNGTFLDLQDWDVSHCRRVRWFWKGLMEFHTYTMGMSRLEPLRSRAVIDWVNTLDKPDENKPLAELPKLPCGDSVCHWTCERSKPPCKVALTVSGTAPQSHVLESDEPISPIRNLSIFVKRIAATVIRLRSADRGQ